MPKLNLKNISFKNNTSWVELIGSPSEFSLESRIFHSISIGLMLLVSIYIPYNLFAGLYVSSLSALIFLLFFLYQFYNSRFHGKPHSNVLFALAGLFIFGINYFTNSGIDGSTDLIWPTYLLLVLAISPYKQHTLWLVLYMCCFIALHGVEYYYPMLVKHPFVAGKGQFIDRITAFPIPVIVTYMIIKFIRRSHDREKKVTEEKAIAIEKSKEEILLQKNLLEESNIEKNKLMSIISHDLRSPLVNIQNYLALLNENEVDSTDRPVIEKALLRSTNSAMEMLSNLLHWSHSQMKGLTVQLTAVNLLSALTNLLEIENIQALKKQITLSYTIPADLVVIADIDMLQLVVRNLISNAVKFTSRNGLINIDAQVINDECKITVSDNGEGMSKAKQDDIFSIKSKPAYGTDNEKGVGLGLVLCKEFIEKQGGKIGFESEPGIGSSFFISLPMQPASSTTQDS